MITPDHPGQNQCREFRDITLANYVLIRLILSDHNGEFYDLLHIFDPESGMLSEISQQNVVRKLHEVSLSSK